MPRKQPPTSAPAAKASGKSHKAAAASQLPPTASSTAAGRGKRGAEPSAALLRSKKPKIADAARTAAVASSPAAIAAARDVVPITPGSKVDTPAATRKDHGAPSSGTAQAQEKGPADNADEPSAENGESAQSNDHVLARQQAREAKKDQQAQRNRMSQKEQHKQRKQNGQQGQPTSLPLEPHEPILSELRPRYDVAVLSVISSSSMEKRIRAVLEHVGKGPLQPPKTAASTAAKSASRLPTVMLLHARADDTGKLLSIAEIVKRRIREGFFAGDEADNMPHKPSTKAWYQYNRVYDVATEVVAPKSDAVEAGTRDGAGDAENDDDDDDDDAFEPMPRRFQEAVGDVTGKRTIPKVYMSIFLSRVPIPELLRQPDVTCQTSGDPIEVEYQGWMGSS